MAEEEGEGRESLIARLFGWHRRKSKPLPEKVSGNDALAEIGLSILDSMSFHERVEFLREWLSEALFLNEDLTPLERVEIMTKIIHRVVLPYARARNDPRFIRMITGWAGLVSWFRSLYRLVEDPTLDQYRREEYKNILDSIAKEDMYEPFLVILAASFGEADLAKNVVAVIQNPVIVTQEEARVRTVEAKKTEELMEEILEKTEEETGGAV